LFSIAPSISEYDDPYGISGGGDTGAAVWFLLPAGRRARKQETMHVEIRIPPMRQWHCMHMFGSWDFDLYHAQGRCNWRRLHGQDGELFGRFNRRFRRGGDRCRHDSKKCAIQRCLVTNLADGSSKLSLPSYVRLQQINLLRLAKDTHHGLKIQEIMKTAKGEVFNPSFFYYSTCCLKSGKQEFEKIKPNCVALSLVITEKNSHRNKKNLPLTFLFICFFTM
jgi:hypothetical protein